MRRGNPGKVSGLSAANLAAPERIYSPITIKNPALDMVALGGNRISMHGIMGLRTYAPQTRPPAKGAALARSKGAPFGFWVVVACRCRNI